MKKGTSDVLCSQILDHSRLDELRARPVQGPIRSVILGLGPAIVCQGCQDAIERCVLTIGLDFIIDRTPPSEAVRTVLGFEEVAVGLAKQSPALKMGLHVPPVAPSSRESDQEVKLHKSRRRRVN